MLDPYSSRQGLDLSDEVRASIVKLIDSGHKDGEISTRFQAAGFTLVPATVKKIRNAMVNQGLQQGSTMKSAAVPEKGRRGGKRWARLTLDQSIALCRIAWQHPRSRLRDLKEHMEYMYDGLQVSETTVWRSLRDGQMRMRYGKMIDPRREGTRAHREELSAFITEQQKAERGLLHGLDLCCIDETSVYLNEMQNKRWGTGEQAPPLYKAKGKTQTIAVYAAIFLPSATRDHPVDAAMPLRDTDPRGSHCVREGQTWRVRQGPLDFGIVWWCRPPEREEAALPRFLTVEDIQSAHFTLSQLQGEPFVPSEDSDALHSFCTDAQDAARGYTTLQLRQLLWLNNIEDRRVDIEGELLQLHESLQQNDKEVLSDAEMRELLRDLLELVRHAIPHASRPPTTETAPAAIPRTFYSWSGRNFKGGVRASVRGDRAAFIQFLKHVRNFVHVQFPPEVLQGMRFAWDSASSHGSVDVTLNRLSPMHSYVVTQLKMPGGCIFLPTRSPDYNPIEMVFGFVKAIVRRRMESVTGEVESSVMVQYVDEAFNEVHRSALEGFFLYGCYHVPGRQPTSFCRVRDADDGQLNVLRLVLDEWASNHSHPLTQYETDQMLHSEPQTRDAYATHLLRIFSETGQIWTHDRKLVRHGVTLLDPERPLQALHVEGIGPLQRGGESHALNEYNVITVDGRPFENVKSQYKQLRACMEHLRRGENDAVHFCAMLWRVAAKATAASTPLSKDAYRTLRRLEAELLCETRDRVPSSQRTLCRLARAAQRAREYAEALDCDADSDEQVLDFLLQHTHAPNEAGVESMVEAASRELQHTPYATSLLFARGRSVNHATDVAIVVLKAYKHERDRASALTRQAVRDFVAFLNSENWERFGAALSAIEDRWRRQRRVSGVPGVQDTNANVQAPLFDPVALRLEFAIQQEARKKLPRDPDARRWPGYPKGGDLGKLQTSVDYIEPHMLRAVTVVEEQDGSNRLRLQLYDESAADVTIEDDPISGVYKSFFNPMAPANVEMLQLAQQRFREAKSKAKKMESGTRSRTSGVQGIIQRNMDGSLLRWITPEPDSEPIPTVLYLDAASNSLYPAQGDTFVDVKANLDSGRREYAIKLHGTNTNPNLASSNGKKPMRVKMQADLDRLKWTLKPRPLSEFVKLHRLPYHKRLYALHPRGDGDTVTIPEEALTLPLDDRNQVRLSRNPSHGTYSVWHVTSGKQYAVVTHEAVLAFQRETAAEQSSASEVSRAVQREYVESFPGYAALGGLGSFVDTANQ